PDGNHDHHRHQRGHGNLRYQVAEKDHHHQQHKAGGETGEPGAAAGFHVDDGLANHGAAGHAADQPGGNVGDTLAFALAVLVAAGVGQVIDDGGGHHGFQQADHGQYGGI